MLLLTPADTAMMVADAASVIASYQQPVVWFARITAATPGAVSAPDFDPIRSQVMTATGPSLGGGYQVTIGARTYLGYIPTPIIAAIADAASLVELTGEGIATAETPLALTSAACAKGDVLVLGTRRFVVEDDLDLLQAFATTLWRVLSLSLRAPGDPLYTLPLP